MIIDTLKNAHKYTGIHPSFAVAFDYISKVDLNTVEIDSYDIDGTNIYAFVSNKQGLTVAESTAKFECHNKHIDIQLCIGTGEKFGWKPREKCTTQKGDYNPQKDVLYYADAPDTFFELSFGQFVIFFPEDVHAPMIGTGNVKKFVVKVKI